MKNKKTLAYYYYKAHNLYERGKTKRARLVYAFMRIVFSCDIPYPTQIGQNVQFPHYGLGVVINPDARIGDNCKIGQNVTIGGRGKPGCPIIGNNVEIGAGALVLGDISIGDNSIIGAGAVVLHSVPSNAVVVGNPARVIKINGVKVE